MASILDQVPYNNYTGNGVATAYPFEFELLDAGDFVASIDGAEVPSSDYTLSGLTQAGGTCTFDTAPANLSAVLLQRLIALERDTDYQYNGDLREATLDRDLNRLWQALQGLLAQLGGSLRLPYPEQADELPSPANRLGKLLSFNASTGAPELVAPSAGTATALALQLADTTSASNSTSLLGWLRNLTGAVATTLKKLLGWQPPTLFEFMTNAQVADVQAGTLLVDVTAAVQAAFSSAAKELRAPAGSYLLTSKVTRSTKLKLIGEGRDSSIFVPRGTFDAFEFNNADHSYLAHFKIINDQAVASRSAGAGLSFIDSGQCSLEDILIQQTFDGIHSVTSPIMRGNRVDLEDMRGVCLRIDGGNAFDNYWSNFIFKCINDGTYRGEASVKLTDMCDEMLFENGIMNMGNYPVITGASSYTVNQRPEFCRFVNVSFDSCANGPLWDNCTDMKIIGGFTSCRPGSGADIGPTNSESVKYIGHTFFNCGGHGAIIRDGAKDTHFTDNDFIDNSQASAGAAHGILVDTNATDWHAAGNVFKNGWGGAGTQGYGIYISAGADRYTITANRFGTLTAGPILDLSTPTERYIFGNIGYRTKAVGLATVLAGNTTVVVSHTLAGTPASEEILVRPNTGSGGVEAWVSAVAATTFTITQSAVSGSNVIYNWQVTIKGN